MTYRMGIDLGGTTAKLALVSAGQKIVREISVPTAGFPNAALLAEKLGAAGKILMKGASVQKVGVGVAGDIDSENGIVRVSPNLGWKNVPLGKLLKKHLKQTVVVENDANAAAWGIFHTQAPKHTQNVIVMTLGTGVGGGIVLNGQLHRGTTGSAGEIGHMVIDEKGPLCNCGNRGCLETFVGGPHLIRYVQEALVAGEKSGLQTVYKRAPDEITPYLIAQFARKRDALALRVWNRVGHALGRAIGDLAYILNPELVIFTGGIAQAGSLILNPLWKTLNTRSFKTPIQALKIKIAADAPHIGALGASLL